jgi:hypothetical protein
VAALRREEGRIVGGELAWLDLGEAGLRIVEPADEAGGLRVRPSSGAAITEELRSYIAT